MACVANSEFIDLDDESPVHSSDGSVTLMQAGEVSEEAKVAPVKQSRKVRSKIDVDERYLQQRAAPPKQDIFKYVTTSALSTTCSDAWTLSSQTTVLSS